MRHIMEQFAEITLLVGVLSGSTSVRITLEGGEMRK